MWGGALEIHSDPRKPFENRVWSYDPLYNRWVMFEKRTVLARFSANRSAARPTAPVKSTSICLYTKDRPAEEIAPMHGTF